MEVVLVLINKFLVYKRKRFYLRMYLNFIFVDNQIESIFKNNQEVIFYKLRDKNVSSKLKGQFE